MILNGDRKILCSYALTAMALLFFAGCSSGAEEASPASNGDIVAESEDIAEVVDATDAPQEEVIEDAAEESSGSGIGIVTVADGTVYEFIMGTCQTSDTADNFLHDNAYDLFGATADGAFEIGFIRAGLDDTAVGVHALEGDFDENGQNSKMIYTNGGQPAGFVVDGGNITGSFAARPIGPTRPHGDMTEITVDIRC